MDDLVGKQIRGYELREKIGQGGYGVVYRAHQEAVGREVAVKVVLPIYAQHPEFTRRFETEAQLVARLEHPHIVPLYDYWRDESGAFLVMRFLRGGTLRDKVRESPIAVEEAVLIIEHLAAALTVAHRNDVIHRDLKLENILLDENGNVYLSDFGIAKVLKAEEHITAPDTIVGTFAYLSPEQLSGEEVTPQSDIYSLGYVLYAMLAGDHPYSELTAAQMMHKHLYTEIPELPTSIPGVSDAVNQVLQRATAKDPVERYPDMLSFAVDFRRTLSGSIGATPTFTERERLFKRITDTQEVVSDDDVVFWEQDSVADQILQLLAEDRLAVRFLAAVGPDGSGKSRAIRNGLIPAVSRHAYFGNTDLFLTELVLTSSPLDSLAEHLASIGDSQPETMLEMLRAGERGLIRAAQAVLPGENSELILVVDQFEEAFSLTEPNADKEQFVKLIKAAVTHSRGRVRVFLTLRPEVYDHPLMNSIFSDLMQLGTLRLLTLQGDPSDAEPRVEIAHDTTIRDWAQLRSWLDDSRYDNQLHKMLSAAARDWKSSNEDGGYLLRGTRLTQYEEWARKPNLILSDEEQAFLIKCLYTKEGSAERDSGQFLAERGILQRLQFIIGLSR